MRYYRIPRRDIAYLRFVLEAYEGLATLTTVDARNGIIALSIPDGFSGDVQLLLTALAQEIDITETGPQGEPLCSEPQETTNDA